MRMKIKFIRLTDVIKTMRYPGAKAPCSRPAVYPYLKQLGVRVRYQRSDGNNHLQACVTAKEARAIYRLFKTKHWRKFEGVRSAGGGK